eukprot:3720043-Heterocapsa_arctica.AAC.1
MAAGSSASTDYNEDMEEPQRHQPQAVPSRGTSPAAPWEAAWGKERGQLPRREKKPIDTRGNCGDRRWQSRHVSWGPT